jgi:hypothetical protein
VKDVPDLRGIVLKIEAGKAAGADHFSTVFIYESEVVKGFVPISALYEGQVFFRISWICVRRPKQISAGFRPIGIIVHICAVGGEYFPHGQSIRFECRNSRENEKHIFSQSSFRLSDFYQMMV